MTNVTANPSEDAAIRELRDGLTDAIRRKDADRVVSYFSDAPVMYILSPPLQFAGDEGPGKDGVKEWFDSFEGPIGYDIRDLHIVAGADVAFCHSLIRISGTRRGGDPTDIWVRETLGLRKLDGAWKIAHQHQSVPFYMDGSNKAAVDLKP